jgi:hypothetical protein
MATNFPGSLDTFTNPTSSSTLDSPSHAAQHANINDAVEAVQSKLGVGAGTIGEWTDFTPTVGASSGTLTTVTKNYAKYTKINDLVIVSYDYTLNNIGTGSGAFRIDVPVNAASTTAGTLFGREINNSGNSLNGELFNVSTLSVLFYNNGAPVQTNNRLRFVVIYEAA